MVLKISETQHTSCGICGLLTYPYTGKTVVSMRVYYGSYLHVFTEITIFMSLLSLIFT